MEGDSSFEITMFKKRLKYLYKKIDSASSLLWSHENRITGAGKRLRSDIKGDDNDLTWKNNETTQIGYGEIAMGSMTSLFNLFQNISRLINFKTKTDSSSKETLIYRPEEYNMNEKSRFLDIGSGFGKPVLHAAFQVGCECKGVEVVPARVEFCVDFYYEFINEKNFYEEVDKKLCCGKSEEIVEIGEHIENIFKEEKSDEENIRRTPPISQCLSSIIPPKNNKFKIYHNENESSFVDCEVNFVNKINMNELNKNYFFDVLNLTGTNKQHYNGYIELKINSEIASNDNFVTYVKEKEKINKSILIEDNTPVYDLDNIHNSYVPVLKFGNCFKLENLTNEITPIDDHLHSNLVKTLLNFIYTNTLERDIFVNLTLNKNERLRNLSELVEKIENKSILNFVLFAINIFLGKKSYYDFNHLFHSSAGLTETRQGSSNLTKDFYEGLREELKSKEKMIKEQEMDIDEEKDSGICLPLQEDEVKILKEILVDLRFHPYNEDWHKKTTFMAKDATNCKEYCNEQKEHFTHIYAYNKLMSKECRSKIAKILNKTKFKILAWYSNPKQTKKAGLKNFTFLSKFPMQSTSTEKFHVYVYIKTK